MNWLLALLVSWFQTCCFFSHPEYISRLYPNLHLGQEVGDLGQRVDIFRWRVWRRPDSCYTEAIQAAVHKRYGTLFSLGELHHEYIRKPGAMIT
jgi:hypothetical protein